jgi:hypothetical protein
VALPIVAVLFAVLACNPGPSTPTPPLQVGTITVSTAEPPTAPPPPASSTGEGECGHDYFPSDLGATWEVTGTNSVLGAFQNSATVSVSSDDGFVVTTDFIDGTGTFALAYSCTDEGLTLLDPLGQSSSAVATGPDGSATVTTLAQSGLSLPADLEAAGTWQQNVKWEAQGSGTVLHGDTTFNYAYRGQENVTVPFGTFEAIRIDTEILTILEGKALEPCQATNWYAEDVGVVQAETSCFGIESSSMLVSFDAP